MHKGHLSVTLENNDAMLRVAGGGRPYRRNREALVLSAGAWARVVTNGRFSGYDGQWYEEDTYNVALVDTLDEEIFVQRAPEATLDDRADLF